MTHDPNNKDCPISAVATKHLNLPDNYCTCPPADEVEQIRARHERHHASRTITQPTESHAQTLLDRAKLLSIVDAQRAELESVKAFINDKCLCPDQSNDRYVHISASCDWCISKSEALAKLEQKP